MDSKSLTLAHLFTYSFLLTDGDDNDDDDYDDYDDDDSM